MKEDLATAIVRPIRHKHLSVDAGVGDDVSPEYHAVSSRNAVSEESTFISEEKAAKAAPWWPFSLSRGFHNPHILGQVVIVDSLSIVVNFDLLATFSAVYHGKVKQDSVVVSWKISSNDDGDGRQGIVEHGASQIDLAVLWHNPVVCAGMVRIPIALKPEVLGVYWIELHANSAACRTPLVIRQAGTPAVLP
ncbi:MAG: hypothetical protein OXG61_00820 [Chloroflexi bacterium]|nr:hypothetical protein [Chloroflexota bacterium]